MPYRPAITFLSGPNVSPTNLVHGPGLAGSNVSHSLAMVSCDPNERVISQALRKQKAYRGNAIALRNSSQPPVFRLWPKCPVFPHLVAELTEIVKLIAACVLVDGVHGSGMFRTYLEDGMMSVLLILSNENYQSYVSRAIQPISELFKNVESFTYRFALQCQSEHRGYRSEY